MLYEFLQTLGETLGFDMESLSSLDSLQRAPLYDSEAEEEQDIAHLPPGKRTGRHEDAADKMAYSP